MADLPATISFKSSVWLKERLQRMAREERRKLGDIVRILLEQRLAQIEEKEAERQ
jgi:hypothetical protein